VLPQILPVLISQALYSIESNSREATILGSSALAGLVCGCRKRIQINAWDQVAYVIRADPDHRGIDRLAVAVAPVAADWRPSQRT